jgi:hypothetical protein
MFGLDTFLQLMIVIIIIVSFFLITSHILKKVEKKRFEVVSNTSQKYKHGVEMNHRYKFEYFVETNLLLNIANQKAVRYI